MHLSRSWFVVPALVLALVLTGCRHKKDEDAAPAGGNPLHPDAAGGGAAGQGAVQRGAQKQVNQNLMRNLGFVYNEYILNNNHAPRSLEEFRSVVASDPNYRNEVAALDKGWVVFLFDKTNPGSNDIVGYEKEEYQHYQNRLAVFGDGHVQTMVNEDFLRAMQGRPGF